MGSDPFASTALIESDDKQHKSVNLQVCVCVLVVGLFAGRDKDDILYLSASVLVSPLCLGVHNVCVLIQTSRLQAWFGDISCTYVTVCCITAVCMRAWEHTT